MRILVAAKQVKAVDAYTIDTIGMPSMVLMGRAAMWMARAVEETTGKAGVVWAVCGTGNNRADGVVVVKMLHLKEYKTSLFIVGDPDRGTTEFLAQPAIARNLGMQMRPWQEAAGEDCVVLIDTVFGIGLSRPIKEEYRRRMEMLEARHAAHTVTTDTPSGIHGNTGQIMEMILKADVAMIFGWEKMGTALYPGRAYAGTVRVRDIDFPESALNVVRDQEEGYGYGFVYKSSDLRLIPDRLAYSNRGTFGRALTAVGSKNIYGAAYLSALAAYRIGTGFVKLLTVEENRQILQERLPEVIIATYASGQLIQGEEESKRMIEEQMNWADMVVLGPGLGSEPYVEHLVEDISTSAFVPIIIDADSPNAIVGHLHLTTYFTKNIIITPRLGEMTRLIGKSIDIVKGNLTGAALEYTGCYGVTCVFRDAATAATGKDGVLYVNSSGNSAMTETGSDDVLTGIIAGLATIGVEEKQVVLMGVYPHGHAGEQTTGKIGQHSLLAFDLADYIGAAMKSVAHKQREALRTKPCSRAYAAIDLGAVTVNMKATRDNLPPPAAMMGVVKADGYGHGAVPVVGTIDPYVEGYAVASTGEGIILRRHGIRRMTLVLGATHESRLEELVHYDIRPAMFRYEGTRKLSGIAVRIGKKANIRLAVDTGMNRIDMRPDERSADMVCRMSRLGGARIEGILTHFTEADELDRIAHTTQYRTYTDLMGILSARDVTIPIRRCSSSAGIVESLESNGLDMVRAGISIYGPYPSDRVDRDAVELMLTMGLKSFITYIKAIEPGDRASYGGAFVVDRTMRVVTTPVGCGDGYLRSLSGEGSVLVRGQRARIPGRVYMDQFMVGVADISGASGDDKVTLVGRDEEECISVEELVEINGGFHYEIIYGIGKCVPRVYLRDNRVTSKKDYSNNICEGFECM